MEDHATVTKAGATDQVERTFERIIGNSAALESVLDQVEQVAPTDSTVLIEGETGTGKELIAHALHNASQRCGRAFIKLNCDAIPLDLLESELFGHEKGAFTGAIAQKIGPSKWPTRGAREGCRPLHPRTASWSLKEGVWSTNRCHRRISVNAGNTSGSTGVRKVRVSS